MEERTRQQAGSLEEAIRQLERKIHQLSTGPDPLVDDRSQAEVSRVLPFPARSSRAGNAVLIDYLYGINSSVPAQSPARPTEELFRYASSAPAARALRSRRQLLSREIDNCCNRRAGQARILCVGSGHLREADLAQGLRHGRFREFVAFDSHPPHLQVVEQSYGNLGVRTCLGSFEQLPGGYPGLRDFDLIYCAGLYEQLDDASAAKLTRDLLQRLKPGGRLLLSNFRPGVPNIAYLEGLLDWRPQYRSADALQELLQGIPDEQIGSTRIFHDLGNCVAFLEVIRHG
ncbi:hypothetical protein D9M71_165580 [compost metagenome]